MPWGRGQDRGGAPCSVGRSHRRVVAARGVGARPRPWGHSQMPWRGGQGRGCAARGRGVATKIVGARPGAVGVRPRPWGCSQGPLGRS